MNRSPVLTNDDPDLARWGLVALALVAAAFMMVYYVHLLQGSVARGEQWRYSQAAAGSQGLAVSGRSAPARVQLVSASR